MPAAGAGALAALLLLGAAAQAAAPTALYHVELVAIVHGDAEARGSVPSAGHPPPPRARTLPEPRPESPPGGLARLGREELRLAALVERAPLPEGARPLGGFGWRLGAGALRAGRAVRLDGELPGLSGMVRLRLGTRLVAEIDARWQPDPATPVAHRLRERRPIRLEEAHYFDHPAFGLILRVRRIEGSPATSSAGGL
ncbi:MAG: CsiV family protein [Xanthomonadales bacterium]|nr:CsiV family protein [Xanthomonadales bacterium]